MPLGAGFEDLKDEFHSQCASLTTLCGSGWEFSEAIHNTHTHIVGMKICYWAGNALPWNFRLFNKYLSSR